MRSDTLKSFFQGYARASMRSDAQALAAHYADDFIVSGGEGSAAFKNDDDFLAWLRGLFDANQELGLQSLEVASLRETPVGDHHALAIVEWATTFQKTGDERICFEISYLVRLAENAPLILAYVQHQDEEEVKRSRGLHQPS